MVEDWKSLLTQKKQVCLKAVAALHALTRFPSCTHSHVNPSFTRQVYCQLAEDDKMRYKNEMQSWENHLVEIGREDLISKIKRKKTNKKSR